MPTHFMNLNKENWRKVKFGDVVTHIEENERNEVVRKNSKYVSVEHLETGNLKIESWETEVMPTFFRKFKKGQILFGKRRAYQRKVAIADFDGICSPHIWALEAINDLSQMFLPYLMLKENFYVYVNAHSAGTMSPYINWRSISEYNFLLPPKAEQEKILAIFQTLENSIEHADEQEKNLRALAKRLIDGLINEQPTFGNLLESQKLSKVKFADVTECIEQHEKQPLEKGLTLFIGLENIEPENFRISTWGNIADGTTFTKTFASGDILFGKRRSYLKKVAIAEFDGICSSDILVFRAKQNKMLAELLPFYAASEAFIQYAVNTSAGSLSPRTKWRDLANFELNIPNLEIQSKILDVLLHIQTTIEQVREQKQTLKNLKFKLLNDILG